MSFKRIVYGFCGLIFLFSISALPSGEEMPVPPKVQVPLILKVLTYDRNLKQKAGTNLVIGILYDSHDDNSKKTRNEISQVLDSLSDKTISGVRFSYGYLDYSSADELKNAINANGVKILYITPGNKSHLSSIIKISQKNKILTMTAVPEYVNKGISVGIGLKENNKPEIWINLSSAKAEGSDFSADLLKLCRVLKKDAR